MLFCKLNIYVIPWKFKAKSKSYGKVDTSIHLDRRLFVVFGIQNLFSTHSADALFVSTALAVMRTRLVHRTFTNSASGELILSIWVKSRFFWSQSFIFIQLSSSTFCGIPCTIFPCIWSDNSTKFLFTFFAHHPLLLWATSRLGSAGSADAEGSAIQKGWRPVSHEATHTWGAMNAVAAWVHHLWHWTSIYTS